MGLEIAGLAVRYGAVTALEGLDLSVPAGELFVLLGGSGSGKTTLLRAIAGFLRPVAGRITLDGVEMTALPPHRRPVNTMFQSYALFPHMSVAANIAFGLRRQGASRAAVASRVAEMLALVRLEGFGDRRPDALSGGQQQRVALARSLAPNPRLLLLDEPLSALDRGLRAETRAELVRLQRRVGTSFILVTHDQEEALTMAHRIGVMAGGRLAQIGTPADIYERPATRLVAEFVGAANVLAGEIRADGIFLRPGLDLAVRSGRSAAPGQALLAIRPERIRVREARREMMEGGSSAVQAPHRPSDDAGDNAADQSAAHGAEVNRVLGEVREVAYAGQSVTYAVRLADDSMLRATQAAVHGFDPARFPVGAPVVLEWEPGACIVLPPG